MEKVYYETVYGRKCLGFMYQGAFYTYDPIQNKGVQGEIAHYKWLYEAEKDISVLNRIEHSVMLTITFLEGKGSKHGQNCC